MWTRTLAIAALLLPLGAQAQFMDLRNEASLARGFGLPPVGAYALAEDARWRFGLDLSNEYHAGQAGSETVVLDGETARYSIDYRHRIGQRLELGFELPLLHQSGGSLDSTIETWHSWFSLPNGGREDAPQGQYQFVYLDGQQRRLDVSETGTRLGELRLTAGWALSPRSALRASVKLPTGDAEALAGNDALAAALWLDHGWTRGSFNAYLSGGALYAARGEVLPEQQRQWLLLGGGGMAWQAWPALRLIAQLNWHTPLYEDVEEDALKRPGIQLGIGGAIRLGARSELMLGFQEDPAVASSPDFSLHLAFVFD